MWFRAGSVGLVGFTGSSVWGRRGLRVLNPSCPNCLRLFGFEFRELTGVYILSFSF